MRIVDQPTWVSAIRAGVTAVQTALAAHGQYDSHDLINWLNINRSAVLNAIVNNYRITASGMPAQNPVHTATREIGKFIARHLGQIKLGKHASARDPIALTGGGVHPGDVCTNSFWQI
jgi:hypothetical protein